LKKIIIGISLSHLEEKISILYRCPKDQFIVVHKPNHISVHPDEWTRPEEKTLMQLVRNQIKQRVYPFQRLDKPVSGLVVFALNPEIVPHLQMIWQHYANKEYTLLCRGQISKAGRFDRKLKDGQSSFKRALTYYWPLAHFSPNKSHFENFSEYSKTPFDQRTTLVRVRIDSGKRHQIRRHFAHAHHPLIGDSEHGKGVINRCYKNFLPHSGLFLHCSKIVLPIQIENSYHKTFSSELPESFSSSLKILNNLQKFPTLSSFQHSQWTDADSICSWNDFLNLPIYPSQLFL